MRPLQAEIIKALGVKPTIDPEKEIRRSIDFLKAYLKKNTFLKTYVLGISGGQDSTLAGTLTEKAMQEMRAETGDDTYQSVAVRLPYGEQADEADAMAAIEFMQADVVKRVNIKPSVDAMVSAVEANGAAISDFNKGNIKARMRMIAQYAIAGNMAGAVIGTDHAAEAVTGFYTKFGDGGADLTPLYRLDKRQGAALLKALGAPAHLYQKAPTAGPCQMKWRLGLSITILMTILKANKLATKLLKPSSVGTRRLLTNDICQSLFSIHFGNNPKNS